MCLDILPEDMGVSKQEAEYFTAFGWDFEMVMGKAVES